MVCINSNAELSLFLSLLIKQVHFSSGGRREGSASPGPASQPATAHTARPSFTSAPRRPPYTSHRPAKAHTVLSRVFSDLHPYFRVGEVILTVGIRHDAPQPSLLAPLCLDSCLAQPYLIPTRCHLLHLTSQVSFVLIDYEKCKGLKVY